MQQLQVKKWKIQGESPKFKENQKLMTIATMKRIARHAQNAMNTYLELLDTDDTSYVGKETWIPSVNSSGTGLVLIPQTDIFNPQYEHFNTVDGQTIVGLANTIPAQYVNMAQVFVNGKKAIIGIHYNLSGATITWIGTVDTSYILEAGDDVEVYYFI